LFHKFNAKLTAYEMHGTVTFCRKAQTINGIRNSAITVALININIPNTSVILSKQNLRLIQHKIYYVLLTLLLLLWKYNLFNNSA